jgi:hypothetical protein
MSVHETSLFFRGKSDRNVMIAPLEGAEGAMGVVVYRNQGKKARGVGAGTLCAGIIRRRLTGWHTIKKASAIAGLKGGVSKRYFFISSFFVASFTFAFPIFTDTT